MGGGGREPIKYFDIYRERPVRLTVRALVPVKEHPKVETVVHCEEEVKEVKEVEEVCSLYFQFPSSTFSLLHYTLNCQNIDPSVVLSRGKLNFMSFSLTLWASCWGRRGTP